MTYLLFISAIIIGAAFPKSRAVSAYVLAAMLVLQISNTWNADYDTYATSYNYAMLGIDRYRYLGFSALQQVSVDHGITYPQYRCLIFLFCAIVLALSVRMISTQPNRVFSCYLVYSFGVDAVQLKSYLAEMICLLGIVLYLRQRASNSRRNESLLIKGIAYLLLIVSTLIHTSLLFYLIIILAIEVYPSARISWKIVLIAVVAVMAALQAGLLPSMMRYLEQLGVISDTAYLERFTIRGTRFGFVITWAAVLMILLSMRLSRHNNVSEWAPSTREPLRLVIEKFMSMVPLVLPLLLISAHFIRLIRIFIIFLYIFHFEFPLPRERVYANQRILSALMFYSTIGYLFYLDIAQTYNTTLGALLNYSTLN